MKFIVVSCLFPTDQIPKSQISSSKNSKSSSIKSLKVYSSVLANAKYSETPQTVTSSSSPQATFSACTSTAIATTMQPSSSSIVAQL